MFATAHGVMGFAYYTLRNLGTAAPSNPFFKPRQLRLPTRFFIYQPLNYMPQYLTLGKYRHDKKNRIRDAGDRGSRGTGRSLAQAFVCGRTRATNSCQRHPVFFRARAERPDAGAVWGRPGGADQLEPQLGRQRRRDTGARHRAQAHASSREDRSESATSPTSKAF